MEVRRGREGGGNDEIRVCWSLVLVLAGRRGGGGSRDKGCSYGATPVDGGG
jgi:hypothetical protein